MPVRMEKDDEFQEDNSPSNDNNSTNYNDNNSSFHFNYNSNSNSSRSSSWLWSIVFNLVVQVVRTLLFRRRR